MKIFNHKFIFILLMLSISQIASAAGPLRWGKNAQQDNGDLEFGESSGEKISLPPGIKVLRNIPYGPDKLQRMDIYLPETKVSNAPVIFMVHGGAWVVGDKGMARMVQSKAARWVPKGFIFISTNYRMLPDTQVPLQTEDIARAFALAQNSAATWGGDPTKFILMGHSAGAHLSAMLSSDPARAYHVGVKPWLGTVSLDSAALDLVKIMENRHARLYDRAFGKDPAYWRANSPSHVLTSSAKTLLAVCSTQRSDGPCPNARDYAAKAAPLGIHVKIIEQNLSHRQINENLGLPGAYTDAVEEFMASLDPVVMQTLRK